MIYTHFQSKRWIFGNTFIECFSSCLCSYFLRNSQLQKKKVPLELIKYWTEITWNHISEVRKLWYISPASNPMGGTFGAYMYMQDGLPLLLSSRPPQRAVPFGCVCGAFFSCYLASACSQPLSVDTGHVSDSAWAQGHWLYCHWMWGCPSHARGRVSHEPVCMCVYRFGTAIDTWK